MHQAHSVALLFGSKHLGWDSASTLKGLEATSFFSVPRRNDDGGGGVDTCAVSQSDFHDPVAVTLCVGRVLTGESACNMVFIPRGHLACNMTLASNCCKAKPIDLKHPKHIKASRWFSAKSRQDYPLVCTHGQLLYELCFVCVAPPGSSVAKVT